MNILELHDTIANRYAKHAADLQDGAAFAYVTQLLNHLKSNGADPTEYEVVITRNDYPEETDEGYKVVNRIRLERREDIKKLPVVGALDD